MTKEKEKAELSHLTDAIKNKELKRDFALYSEIETEKMMDPNKK
ncbi:hypothetical protein [Litchfieldia salsa]|nr:hypothetical protein [Litchfieldia salsa]